MAGQPTINSGIDLIVWSTLASRNGTFLEAATDRDVFNAHWPNIDKKFGRWLCWVAFCVGAESVVKGAFGLNGHPMGAFGACHPWKKCLQMPDAHIGFVARAINRLATEVRNRDAHEYVANVRDKDFPALASEFVPALNRILECVAADKSQT